MSTPGDGVALVLNAGEGGQADPGDKLGEDERLLGQFVSPGEQSGGSATKTGRAEDGNQAVFEHQQEALALEFGSEIEVLAKAAALDQGDRSPAIEKEEKEGGDDARPDVGGYQGPGSDAGHGESDSGGVKPDGAGYVGHGQAAEVEMTFEHGGGHRAEGADQDGERKRADQPGIGGALVNEIQDYGTGEKDDRGGDYDEDRLDGEDGAEIGFARLVGSLDQAGGQAEIAELLDDSGDEGDRYDKPEYFRKQQAVKGDVAGERQDAHAAFPQPERRDPGESSPPDVGG